jgi:SAM-dependent methyltransferase
MNRRVGTLRLPSRDRMIMTNDDDPIDYYYKPLTGWLYRRRLEIGLTLLGDGHRQRILEIGYGSGILLPTLAERCDELSAVDIHENTAPVEEMLIAEGVQAHLVVGSVLHLDFPDMRFDAVICLSVLEHLAPAELAQALAEIRRVLRPGGEAVLGFPVRNAITGTFYKLVGFDPTELHPSGHRQILAAIQSALDESYVTWFPRWLPLDLALYMGVRGRPGAD